MGPRLSEAIDRCVQSALAGEASLEELIGRLVLGRSPDAEHDERWRPEHDAVWNEAVRRWTAARRPRRARAVKERGKTLNPPTVAEVWAVVLRVVGEGWTVPHLTWPALSAQIGVGARAVQWFTAAQGWAFTGKAETRRIIAAPCIVCRDPNPIEYLNDHGCCPTCS